MVINQSGPVTETLHSDILKHEKQVAIVSPDFYLFFLFFKVLHVRCHNQKCVNELSPRIGYLSKTTENICGYRLLE